MPLTPADSRQRRAMLGVVAIFAGGITLIVLLILLSTDEGPNTRAVDTASDRTTSTSSRRIPVPTSFSPATFPRVSVPTAPPSTRPPPTVIVIPPTAPPATQPPPKKAKKQPKKQAPTTQLPPTTQAPTTQPPATTQPTPTTQTPTTQPPATTQPTPTTRPPAFVALEEVLETVLTPDPAMPARVAVTTGPAGRVRITWSLDPTLETPAQKKVARKEAYDLLTAMQSAGVPGTGDVVLRATLPAPDADAPRRVPVKLVFQRTTLDEDFTTVDPQDVFTLADTKVIAPFLRVAATPASTTTSPTAPTNGR